jgi:uncharacterized cupredoxin-like copper-binding protein
MPMRYLRLVVIAGLVLAGACGDDGGGAKKLTVVGTEMAFDAPDTVAPGRYDVTFRNAGALPHELAFKNPAGEFVMRRSIAAGETVTLEVDLSAEGAWELGCYEPGHYEAGMHRMMMVGT